MKQPFTVFRCTNQFMQSFNINTHHRDLHRQRCDFLPSHGEDNEEASAIEAINQLLSAGHLVPVATVNCELSELIRETNTISRFWAENKSVTLLPGAESAQLSSTRIGDIFQGADGQFILTTPYSLQPLFQDEHGLLHIINTK